MMQDDYKRVKGRYIYPGKNCADDNYPHIDYQDYMEDLSEGTQKIAEKNHPSTFFKRSHILELI